MINFKKISAITGSALMVGMTMGVAAAANYPAPFVQGGAANVAIVYGTGSGVSILDAVEAGSIQSNLQTYVSGTSGSVSGSVSGEAVALFSGGTKLYINDTLNTVKNTVTKTDLPNTLPDETFSGDVDAKITQSVQIGNNPRITFERQPTNSDDPTIVLRTSTTDTQPMFNLTATFNKAVNPAHADSAGTTFKLFGMDLTVGADSDSDSIVLLKSADKVDLTSDAPTTSVDIAGATYTVELVSASDTAATIKVTNSAGASESKEINEDTSKKVNGITVAVTTADETNLKLSASVIVGADKLTLEDGQAVLLGEDDTVVDGTLVDFDSGNATALTKLTISFDAPTSDQDAILAGSSYTDPVFGTIKLEFAGISIPDESTAREMITVSSSGDDELGVKFNDYRGYEIDTAYVANVSGSIGLSYTADDWYNISVHEGEVLHLGDYVMVGNEDDGYLLEVVSTTNSSGTVKVTFKDVATSDTYSAEWSSGPSGTLSLGGFDYSVRVPNRPTSVTAEFVNITIAMPDSTANGIVVYPTIETAKGAKVAFYEPLLINLSNFNDVARHLGNVNNNVSALLFPDGDGYETVTLTNTLSGILGNWSLVADGINYQINTTSTGVAGGGATGFNSTTITMGVLTYNVSGTGVKDQLSIKLNSPGTATGMDEPVLIVWEEEDDNDVYHALIVTTEVGGSSEDGIGVADVIDTWSQDSSFWESTLKSDSDITKQLTLWGSMISLDSSESDQASAIISYPDEQVYAELYIAASDAAITAGTISGGGASIGDVLVKDSEVSSVSTKNLVVVGGSCINSVAANLVGGAYCGSGFTDATGVGSGQFLIESFGDAYSTGKIALLVAGYEVSDTVNAAKYLRTQAVMTDSGKKYIGTSSTSATLQTTETTA